MKSERINFDDNFYPDAYNLWDIFQVFRRDLEIEARKDGAEAMDMIRQFIFQFLETFDELEHPLCNDGLIEFDPKYKDIKETWDDPAVVVKTVFRGIEQALDIASDTYNVKSMFSVS